MFNKPQVKSEERPILIHEGDSLRVDAQTVWIDQYDRCAMEHLDCLSADSSDDAIKRIASLCSRWAEASLAEVEARWAQRK